MHATLFLSILVFVRWVDASWRFVLMFYGLLYVCMGAWWVLSRKIIKAYRSRGFNYKRIIILGAGEAAQRLLEELRNDAGYGYRIVGIFDDTPQAGELEGYVGPIADVEQFIAQNLVDEMFCAIPDTEQSTVSDMIRLADRHAIDFYYVPQFNRTVTRKFEIYSMGNVPVLAVRPYPLSNAINRFIKRAFDIVVSSIVLILSPIVLIPVAIGIKLSSPGPIFFKQKRTGYRGKDFYCYKFRSMKVNEDSDKVQATKDDPRVTKWGRFMRHTNIDELPQFINVFFGDMSVVGPRPHMLAHTEYYSEKIGDYMIRHFVKPGITGWAQTHGERGETKTVDDMARRVEKDIWYIEHWSFWLDIQIIFKTIRDVIIGDAKAY
jgi:putative colanic acid biosynthesis UDP-glucose lipid carrier transferase